MVPLFNVNAAVSNAWSQNNIGKSVRNIIDCTISNNGTVMTIGHTIMLWCSRWHEFVKLFHIFLTEGQTHNSNIHLHDQIVETFFSCYDDFALHSEIIWTFQMFQTYVSSSRYTHIFSNHPWRSKLTIPAAGINTHRTAYISMYYFQSSLLLAPFFRRMES